MNKHSNQERLIVSKLTFCKIATALVLFLVFLGPVSVNAEGPLNEAKIFQVCVEEHANEVFAVGEIHPKSEEAVNTIAEYCTCVLNEARTAFINSTGQQGIQVSAVQTFFGYMILSVQDDWRNKLLRSCMPWGVGQG